MTQRTVLPILTAVAIIIYAGLESPLAAQGDDCRTCHINPSGTRHSFFGWCDPEEPGPYCMTCGEAGCHSTVEDGDCDDHGHSDCGDTQTFALVLLDALQHGQSDAVIALASRFEMHGVAQFNAERNSIQFRCGSKIVTNLPLREPLAVLQ